MEDAPPSEAMAADTSWSLRGIGRTMIVMTDEHDAVTAEDLMAGMFDDSDPAMSSALADASNWVGEGIEGVGEGRTADGEPCIVVMVSELDPERRAKIPTEFRGFEVVHLETDTIHAFDDSTD